MKHLIIFLGTIALLSACGGDAPRQHSGLTPFPDRNEPKDVKLTEAVTNFIQKRSAPTNSEYDFIRVDLNNDGRRDGIVLFKLPHTYWCGWDGCGMVIFKAGSDDFTLLSTVSNVRGPIYVSSESNNGWRDIIIRVSGARMADKNIKLEFNNGVYPQSPLLAPTLTRPVSTLNVETFFR